MIDLQQLTQSLAYSKVSKEKLAEAISLATMGINKLAGENKEVRDSMVGLLMVIAVGSFQEGMARGIAKEKAPVCPDCGEQHESI